MSSDFECKHVRSNHFDKSRLQNVDHPEACKCSGSGCNYEGTNLWQCLHLKCAFLGCGERQNDCSTQHYDKSRHALVFNVGSNRIWCYDCEQEVKLSTSPSANSTKSNSVVRENHALQPRNNSHPQSNRVAASTSKYRYINKVVFGDSDANGGRVGLRNLGNTCYLNAAVQALSNCPPFTRYFIDLQHLVVTDPNAVGDNNTALTPAKQSRRLAVSFADLVNQIWSTRLGSSAPIVPQAFVREFQIAFGSFRIGSQQDAQEFLRCFLDRVHDELKIPVTVCASSRSPSAGDDDNGESLDEQESVSERDDRITNGHESVQSVNGESDEKVRKDQSYASVKRSDSDSAYATGGSSVSTLRDEHLEADATKAVASGRRKLKAEASEKRTEASPVYRSVVTDVFEGKLLSTVRCLACDHVSTIVESFMDLSLPIPLSSASKAPKSGANLGAQIDAANSNTVHSSSNSSASQCQPQKTAEFELTKRGRGGSTDNQNESRNLLDSEVDSKKRRRANTKQSSFLATFLTFLSVFFWLRLAYRGILWLFSWYGSVKGLFVTAPIGLHDCLDAYFRADELKGENRYYCERCRTLRNGLKYAQVLRLPEVLCIHLKRFRHDFTQSTKVHNYVEFPLDGLDMRPYLHADCRDLVTSYDLVAVVMHHGGAGGGHYTSYALNMFDAEWYEFDDSSVDRVDAFAVQNAGAYMLFYRKKEDRVIAAREEVNRLLESQQRQGDGGSLMQFYVALEWFQKLTYFAEPGPPDNSFFVCSHGAVHPRRCGPQLPISDRVVELNPAVWSYIQSQFANSPSRIHRSSEDADAEVDAESSTSVALNDTQYRGGPIVTHLAVCRRCELVERRLAERRAREHRELKTMFEHLPHAIRSPNENTYAMSTKWLQSWEQFVLGKSPELPPQIDNRSICIRPDRSSGAASSHPDSKNVQADNRTTVYHLNPRSDYFEVSEEIWNYLRDNYGGGPPVLVRKARTTSTDGAQQHRDASASHTSPSLNSRSSEDEQETGSRPARNGEQRVNDLAASDESASEQD